MSQGAKHKWTFRARFRRRAFGWQSQPAEKRVREAITEIKKTARKEPVLGAEGGVLFLEKVSPALEQVDSSSGALGTAVNKAVETLSHIIAKAGADGERHDQWIERLWCAVQEDDIPYIEALPVHWGQLCVTPERASHWADRLIDETRAALSSPTFSSYKTSTACLSALLKAEHYDVILELLKLDPLKIWHYRKWGVRALVAKGKKKAALRYAEGARRGRDKPDWLPPLYRDEDCDISLCCEEILLSSGMTEEAYDRYALQANIKSTYLATFRTITKKYPVKAPADILDDLVATTPGSEGKWFAAAKSAGLHEEAIRLANRTPCDPKTLTRAARDMLEKDPAFALEAGIAALRWFLEGYGYEITNFDVLAAFDYTLAAAGKTACQQETFDRIRQMMASEKTSKFVRQILEGRLSMEMPHRA